MGYYTNYYLTAKGYPNPMTKGDAETLAEDIRNSTDLEYVSFHKNMGDYGYAIEADAEAKWYECEDDMYKLSKRWPGVLFDLRGDGEESEDLWEHYWLNGEVQKDGIVIQTNRFERSKLEPYK